MRLRKRAGSEDLAKKGAKPAKAIKIGFGWQITLWLLLAVGVAAGAMLSGWTVLGRPHLAPAGNQLPTEVFLDLLKISLTVVAGVGGIVALVVAYRKQRLGEAQHQREELASKREDQKLYSERFSKVSELLGSERSAARLAAVYALGSLADDWEAGRQTCIDVLCAYLRMPHKPLNAPPIDKILENQNRPFARDAWRLSLLDDSALNPAEEHQVRSTIIRVIVEHLNPDSDVPWFGHRFNFRGAVLDSPQFFDTHFQNCYVDFTEAFLYGEIEFSGSRFTDSEVHFSSTIIGGTCAFEVCDFRNSKISFVADIVDGGGLKFYWSKMTNTEINLVGLELTNGAFSFIEIEMQDSNLDIGRAEIENSSVALSRSHLKDSKIAFHNASFTDSTMFLSGVRIGNNSRVFFTRHIHEEVSGPTLTDTKLYLNDVGIATGGFLGFQGQHFLRTPLTWELLEMSDSELVVTESVLESSPIAFEDSELADRSRLVIDVCSSDTNPVNLSGLSQPQNGEEALVVVRPGEISDVGRSSWTQPRTSQYADVDPDLRPHIKSWI